MDAMLAGGARWAVEQGYGTVADLDRIRIVELEKRQFLAADIDLQHGEIGPLVGTEELSLEFTVVGEYGDDLVGAGHDVMVGYDRAVAIDDDARAKGVLYPRPGAAEAEILTKKYDLHLRGRG